MKEYNYWLVPAVLAALAAVVLSKPDTPAKTPAKSDTYGSVAVSRVMRIAPDGTIYCHIDAFPPVVGDNIPVVLEGIETTAETVDKEVIAFLEQTFTPASQESAPSIVLHNIRRGRTFCLIGDIEVDGKDVGQLLVEKGLARRIIRLETAEPSPSSAAGAPLPVKPDAATAVTYVASRTSKIFHRSDCSHAKRLKPETTLTFRTRREAEQNGRRPCKTCNP